MARGVSGTRGGMGMDARTGSSTGLPAFGDEHSTRGALKPTEIVLLSASHKTTNPKIIHKEARVLLLA